MKEFYTTKNDFRVYPFVATPQAANALYSVSCHLGQPSHLTNRVKIATAQPHHAHHFASKQPPPNQPSRSTTKPKLGKRQYTAQQAPTYHANTSSPPQRAVTWSSLNQSCLVHVRGGKSTWVVYDSDTFCRLSTTVRHEPKANR
jgi:hypothetical protein